MVRLLDKAGELKHHEGNVPLVGGLAILAGYLVALAIYPVSLQPNTVFLIASFCSLYPKPWMTDSYYVRSYS